MFSSPPPLAKPSRIFHPALRVYQIWGTREGVGKTIFSTVLAWAAARGRRAKGARDHVGYMKPLTTGDFSQAEHIRVRSAFFKLMQGKSIPPFFHTKALFHQHVAPGLLTPKVRDQELLLGLEKYAAEIAKDLDYPGGWLFLETLKDVEAKLPSGKCQANVYPVLGIPAILVGDAAQDDLDDMTRAYESLRKRDYDVQSVVVFKDAAKSYVQIAEHFHKLGVSCLPVRPIPDRHADVRKDGKITIHYIDGVARSNALKGLLRTLYETHNARAKALDDSIPPEVKDQGETVWDKPLSFSFAVPGKHKHKV